MTFDVQPTYADGPDRRSGPGVGHADGRRRRRRPARSRPTRPGPAFYETSVADALAAHSRSCSFATPKFCTSEQCGPTLDSIKPIAEAHPDVTFINVEPYVSRTPTASSSRCSTRTTELQAARRPTSGACCRAVDLRRRSATGSSRGRSRASSARRSWTRALRRRGRSGGSPRLLASSRRNATPRAPSVRYQTRIGDAQRLVLGEVTGRELGAVLQRADARRCSRAARRGHPERRPPHDRRSSRPRSIEVTNRPADGPFLRDPWAGRGPRPNDGAASGGDAITASARDEEPERPAVHPPARPVAPPVPVLPGAWSGSPVAQRGQVAGPGRTSAGRAAKERSGYGAAGPRRLERGPPPLRSTSTSHSMISPPSVLDGRDHRQERAAGREDVVDEQDALAGVDAEPAPELAVGGAVGVPDLLGEDRPKAELAGGLEGEDDAAGRRAGDHVDHRLAVAAADAGGPQAAQLAGRSGVLEDLELLDVGVAVAAALEQEMALAEGAGLPEDALGAQRRSRAEQPRRWQVERWSRPKSRGR